MNRARESFRIWSIIMASCVLCLLAGCQGTKERAVTIRYTPVPDKAEILDGTKDAPIRVCVNQVDVKWDTQEHDSRANTMQTWSFKYVYGAEPCQVGSLQIGVVSSTDKERHAKTWENLCRSLIGGKIPAGALADGKYVVMVSREDMSDIINEEDLRNAGIVAQEASTFGVKQLPVDLMIFGDINVLTHYEVTWKTDKFAKIAVHTPYVGGFFGDAAHRPKKRIQRTVTFAGNFRAIDARTGKVWLSHDFSDQEFEDKKPMPLFGSSKSRMDLESEDQIVKRFLEAELDKFVGRMVSVPLESTVWVKSSKAEHCCEGVKQLPFDAALALEYFRAALAEDPEDHRASFAAGVALEKLGRLTEAREKYRRAQRLIGASVKNKKGHKTKGKQMQYAAAVERIENRLERGEKAESGPQLEEQPIHETKIVSAS